MKKSHEGGQRKTSTRTTEPRVGIFWLVDGEPLIDSTSLSEAEPYGDHLTILGVMPKCGGSTSEAVWSPKKWNTKSPHVGG